LAGVPEVGEEPAEAPQRPDLLIIMGSMWIGTALAAIDGTCVASILETVGSEFKVSTEIQWLGVSICLFIWLLQDTQTDQMLENLLSRHLIS
jgi:hypothetical protein